MKIATWNVNSLRVRQSQLSTWLASNPVDIIALQEIKLQDEIFPQTELKSLGYYSACSGQRTYNGVAILSRLPIEDVSTGIPDFADEQKRVIAATINGVRVINVYVPNGQTPQSDKFVYKLAWLNALRAYVQTEMAQYSKLVILGDYNIAPEDRDVDDPKSWEGSVHVTAEERVALGNLQALGLVDLYRQFEQAEGSYSWWDYRAMAFRRNHGLRIDLILSTAELAKCSAACTIDKTPRTWERPSDHAPVIAEFAI